jgi:uncharacterized membrane protein YgdD (TMEM256/DUF423 family)
MSRVTFAIAGLGGLISVAAGAAAAHLAARDAAAAALLRTAAGYGMVHAAALLALAAIEERRRRHDVVLTLAAGGFAAGIVLFSGSLLALALTGIRWLRWVTPFGGAGFLLGWAAIAVAALRRPDR